MTDYQYRFVLGAAVLDDAATQSFYTALDGTLARRDERWLATVYGEGTNAIGVGRRLVVDLEQAIGVPVTGVDMDLVDAGEIARRIGVTKQAVHKMRHAATRDPWPAPLGSPGGRRVWAWGDVNVWLRRNRPDSARPEHQLTSDECACLHAWLTDRRSMTPRRHEHVTAERIWDISTTSVPRAVGLGAHVVTIERNAGPATKKFSVHLPPARARVAS